MLDLRFLREQPDTVREQIARKRFPEALARFDELLVVDAEEREVRKQLEQVQTTRNRVSREIGELKRSGEDASELLTEMSSVSEQVKSLEEQQRTLAARVQALALEIPNLPDPSVPDGEGSEDNVVAKLVGEPREFSFAPKPHWELLGEDNWLALEAGNKISGSGFPIFMGPGAQLVRALKNWLLDELVAAGYLEVHPSLLVTAATATATGQLPDKEQQMYEVPLDGMFLIPTSEVVLTALHLDEILDTDQLPLRYTAFSACFRREAGSYGAHVRGLNRVHQFDKVEMMQFTTAEQSYDALEEMTSTAEGLLDKLGLHYRRLLLCTGDMGMTQAKTYDLEVWSAAQERWLEVSSVSNILSYQANRARTRGRSGGQSGSGKTEAVHTLNGSAFGFPRLIAGVVEQYQQADGSIAVPEVLKPYLRRDVL